ncbi:MAG: YjjI family glycine radical enzyme [bacterium]|nr:YjjI family glycine radical enzyme [bacterium]
MENVLDTIKNRQLTFEQKVIQLARQAENSLEVLDITPEITEYMNKGIICDLYEGNAPYRPRYILPDYRKFMEKGSEFLKLAPPKNLYEAVNHLQILYKHTPSISTYPVFLGNIDTLLEPFIEDETQAYTIIKLFLTHIDRTLTDSFVHANIGPTDTKAGRLILKAERELVHSVPNLTLKYDTNTPDDFALEAIRTGLAAAKPYFANHTQFVKDFGEDYGIASCYNGLPTAGGSHTLVRMNLKNLAFESADETDFLENVLPHAVALMCRLMDQRIKFLVEESGFFEGHFLVKEGLIDKNRFGAMFGVHGLAECVNHLLKAADLKNKFGRSAAANKLGECILKVLEKEVHKHSNPYCQIAGGRFWLHAQCGIGDDVDTTPGCRIPPGDEPETLEHILQASMYHKYFPAGTSDIFVFDETAQRNPEALLDIIKGAMFCGLRIFAFYQSDNDLIRITGYLVKRSEMEKYRSGCQNLKDTVALGAPSSKSLNIEKRKVIKVDG